MAEFLPELLYGVRVISAVSGGAVLAMLLARHLGPEAGDTPERRWNAALRATCGPLQQLMCADLRNLALFSPPHLVRGLVSGEWDPSACVVAEYSKLLGPGRAANDQTPCFVVNTVRLNDGAIVGLVTVGQDHDAMARWVAAATAIPGVFNPVLISEGPSTTALPHIDASVADKLGVVVLARLGCSDIVSLDGSTGVSMEGDEFVSAVASAHCLLTQPVEVRRREMLDARCLHIGLRPSGGSHAIDGRILQSLQRMRTDLDQFTELEYVPLVVAGYLMAAGAAGFDEAAANRRLRALEAGASGPFKNLLRKMLCVWDAMTASVKASERSIAYHTVLEALDRSRYHAGRDLRSRVTLYRRLGSIEAGAFLWVTMCMLLLVWSTAGELADWLDEVVAPWLGRAAPPGLVYFSFATIAYAWIGRQLVRHYDRGAVASWRTSLAILILPLLAIPYLIVRLWLGLHRETRHLAELASVAPFGNTVAGRARWVRAEMRNFPGGSDRQSWYVVLLLGCAAVLAYVTSHMIEDFGAALLVAAALALFIWFVLQLVTRGFPAGNA